MTDAKKPPPKLLPPIVVMTRPQDWAPKARAVLWPELAAAARVQEAARVRR